MKNGTITRFIYVSFLNTGFVRCNAIGTFDATYKRKWYKVEKLNYLFTVKCEDDFRSLQSSGTAADAYVCRVNRLGWVGCRLSVFFVQLQLNKHHTHICSVTFIKHIIFYLGHKQPTCRFASTTNTDVSLCF